jgi:pimeloyl-ACP methyl ester carboxylesterase
MIEPVEGLVDAGGIRLQHLTWSAGSGRPPILLLHATGFLARLWQPVAETLASRYTVHALDTRGHGDSDKPLPTQHSAPGTRHPYDWHNFVDDLAAFMDSLGLRGIPIAGHSSGGTTAAHLAATHPGYASALVLIEPIIRPAGFTFNEGRPNDMSEAARRRRTVWSSRGEIVDAYRQRPAFAGWRQDVLALYAEHGAFQREDGQFELKCPAEVEAQVFDNSTSLDTWDLLPGIACPTLLMRGETTDPYLAMMLDGAARAIPGARTATVPAAGHLSPMEQPQAVAEIILEFLEAADV